MFWEVRNTSQVAADSVSVTAPIAHAPIKPRPKTLNQAFNHISVPDYIRFSELIERISQGCGDVAPVLAGFESTTIRDKILPILIHRRDQMLLPLQRTEILRGLLPFADDELVKEYALQTLGRSRFQDIEEVVVAAARVLLEGGVTLDDRHIERIACLAERIGGTKESLAANAAQYILLHLPPSPALTSRAMHLAHSWFLARKGSENPWLTVLSRQPSRQSFRFFRNVVGGEVPHTKEPSPLQIVIKASLNLHSAAALAGTVGVVVNEILSAAGILGQVSPLQAFCLSAGLLYGVKALGNAFLVEVANHDRDYERLEAIAHISAMQELARKSGGSEGIKLAEAICSFLLDVSNDLSQNSRIREAAYAASREPVMLRDLLSRAGNE